MRSGHGEVNKGDRPIVTQLVAEAAESVDQFRIDCDGETKHERRRKSRS